jgi:hypothetical protein
LIDLTTTKKFNEDLLKLDEYLQEFFDDLITYATTGTKPARLPQNVVDTFETELVNVQNLGAHLFDTTKHVFDDTIQRLFFELSAILRTLITLRKDISNIFQLSEDLVDEYLRNFGFDKYPLLYLENKRRLLDTLGGFYKQKGTFSSVEYLTRLLDLTGSNLFEYKMYIEQETGRVRFILHERDTMDYIRKRNFDQVTNDDPTWHLTEQETKDLMDDAGIGGLVDSPYFAIFVLSEDHLSIQEQVRCFCALMVSLIRRDLTIYENGVDDDIETMRNIKIELFEDAPTVSFFELLLALAFTYRYKWTYLTSDPDNPICSDSTSAWVQMHCDTTSFEGYGYYYNFFEDGHYDLTDYSSALEAALAEINHPERRISSTGKSIVEQIEDDLTYYSYIPEDDPNTRLGTNVTDREYLISLKSAIFTSIYSYDMNYSYKPYSRLYEINQSFAETLKAYLDSAHPEFTQKSLIEIAFNKLASFLTQYIISRYQNIKFTSLSLLTMCLDATIREMVEYIKPVHAKLEELGAIIEVREYPEEIAATQGDMQGDILHKHMERLPGCILYDRGYHFDDWIRELRYREECCQDSTWSPPAPAVEQWYFDDCIKEYISIMIHDSTGAILRYDIGARYDDGRFYDYNWEFIQWWREQYGYG